LVKHQNVINAKFTHLTTKQPTNLHLYDNVTLNGISIRLYEADVQTDNLSTGNNIHKDVLL